MTNKEEDISTVAKIAAAGSAGVTADLFTFPLDTIKVWLMVRKTTKKKNVEKPLPPQPISTVSVSPKMSQTQISRPISWNKFRSNVGLNKRIEEALLKKNQTASQAKTSVSLNTAKPPASAISLILHNIRTNGIRGLYGGITAGLQRQVAFCAVRIGCYDTIKNFYQDLLPASPDSKQILKGYLLAPHLHY
jgi:hypothetical protein